MWLPQHLTWRLDSFVELGEDLGYARILLTLTLSEWWPDVQEVSYREVSSLLIAEGALTLTLTATENMDALAFS